MTNGTLIGNRYEIVETIGKGGMAIVYKAKCQILNRYVALKVLRPEYREDKDFISRFKVEAQSAGSLSHPNVVSIYDVVQEDDLDYIVMEYVEGVTLKQYVEAKGTIPWREAVDYAAQICAGLDHAHKKGIVHKDIK
ncbi:MAG: serine/threonine protein kinase, partial [Ruminococcaceae bacterium]|nr:serine/threonine protein kinase [Oscillospiraceae bacterium]